MNREDNTSVIDTLLFILDNCGLFKLFKVVSLPQLIDPFELFPFMTLLECFLAQGSLLSVGAHDFIDSPLSFRIPY